MKAISLLAAFLLLFATKFLQAQTHVVPTTYATTDGDATFIGPLANSARTYQVLIHENQLTQLVGTQLTGLTFRSSTSATTTWPASTAVYNNYDIYLSGSVLPANRSLVMESNIVGVQKKVRGGSLTISAGTFPVGGPTSFGQVIQFDSNYTYTGGNLLLEIRHDGISGGTTRSVNSIGTSNAIYNNAVSACWKSSYTTIATNASNGNAAVVQFSYISNTTPITSLAVSTQASAPATITTNAGTLQMVATILPATANQSVTWSIVPGTGTATISAAGLVTAQTNGTVWAKAVSIQDNTKLDSLQITISNQVPPVASLVVSTQGSVPATITTNAGTLQMVATVLPTTANQSVTWSIVPGTGAATISTAGLVTAQSNGTVWAKAVSTADATKRDSLLVTISNQIVPVTSVVVSTQGSVPATISTNAGTLQMVANVLPATANQNVTWSIVLGTGAATISTGGLVTAQSNGSVWAKAVSVQDNTKFDSLQITITNQVIPISSLVVTTQASVPSTITTNAGTLQMVATVLPVTANQNVTWSIVPGTGAASISTTGLVAAQSNGTVWAKAISVQDNTKLDSLLITISNQIVPVTSLVVSTQGSIPATITVNTGTLQMVATVLPATANQNVTWSIVPGTGSATISTAGLVTAQSNGTVWAKAVSVQDNTKLDSLLITISNQTIPLSSIVVSVLGAAPSVINSPGGALQMVATILPANANQQVNWSIVPGTGTAVISNSGLVTAQTDGTVWAKAVSVQDNDFKDSLLITISNQTTGIQKTENGDKVDVYPNPVTNNQFTVRVDRSLFIGNEISFTVLDLRGRILKQGKLPNETTTVSMSSLAAGVYYLRIKGNKLNAHYTLVKDK